MSDYNKVYRALEAFLQRNENKTPEARARMLESVDKMKTLLSKHLKRINYSYMRTVFFPE